MGIPKRRPTKRVRAQALSRTEKKPARSSSHLRALTPRELSDCQAFRSRWEKVNEGLKRTDPNYLSAVKLARLSIARLVTSSERNEQTWSDMKNGKRAVTCDANLVAALAMNETPQAICPLWQFPELTVLPPNVGRELLKLSPQAFREMLFILASLLTATTPTRKKALAAIYDLLTEEAKAPVLSSAE